LFLTCASNGRTPAGGELVPSDPRATIGVTSSNICVPPGLFFIVRKGDRRAAVRFTEVRRLKAAGTGYATYESYERAGADGRFSDAGKQTSTVSVLGWSGFHPLSQQKGDARLHAGPVTLDYNFPSCVSFTPHDVEIAPTHWTDIREVNANAPALRWFTYDSGGERHLELQRDDL
jgi:hypothetical protein